MTLVVADDRGCFLTTETLVLIFPPVVLLLLFSTSELSHSELRSSELASPYSVVGCKKVNDSLYCSYPRAKLDKPLEAEEEFSLFANNRLGDRLGEDMDILRTVRSKLLVTSSTSPSINASSPVPPTLSVFSAASWEVSQR